MAVSFSRGTQYRHQKFFLLYGEHPKNGFWEFLKSWAPFFAVPKIRLIVFLDLLLGSPSFWEHHFGAWGRRAEQIAALLSLPMQTEAEEPTNPRSIGGLDAKPRKRDCRGDYMGTTFHGGYLDYSSYARSSTFLLKRILSRTPFALGKPGTFAGLPRATLFREPPYGRLLKFWVPGKCSP